MQHHRAAGHVSGLVQEEYSSHLAITGSTVITYDSGPLMGHVLVMLLHSWLAGTVCSLLSDCVQPP